MEKGKISVKLITCPLNKLQFYLGCKRKKERCIKYEIYERKEESTQKNIERTRVSAAMINT